MSSRRRPDQSIGITQFSNIPPDLQKIWALEYIASWQPFAGYGLKSVLDAVNVQLATKCYAIALENHTILGYIGWVLTTKDSVELWRGGSGQLRAISEKPDAAVITILAVSSPKLILPLVRFAFRQADSLPIFWKRDIAGKGLIARQINRS